MSVTYQDPTPQPVPPPPADEPPSFRQPTEAIIREIIETLLLTLFIFWLVNAVIGRYRIQGPSMQSTLWEGQYLIINKTAYFLEEPERGDVIVFHPPYDNVTNLIKRVVGVPGDVVRVENRQVYINDVLLDEPYINEPPNYTDTWTVPEGEFFVLGDNRNNSSDSHNWSFLPDDNIIGKAMIIYWPPEDWQAIPHYAHTELPAALP